MSKLEDAQLLNNYDPPKWLREALDVSSAPPEFRARCEEAASVALSIARMRRERNRSQPFAELSLASYASMIAKDAGVEIDPVLRWLGLSTLTSINSETIRGAVRLAKEIGLTLRETIAHIRIGFLEAHGVASFSSVVAQRGTAARGLESCEAALADKESSYTLAELQDIRELESTIHSVYRELD